MAFSAAQNSTRTALASFHPELFRIQYAEYIIRYRQDSTRNYDNCYASSGAKYILYWQDSTRNYFPPFQCAEHGIGQILPGTISAYSAQNTAIGDILPGTISAYHLRRIRPSAIFYAELQSTADPVKKKKSMIIVLLLLSCADSRGITASHIFDGTRTVLVLLSRPSGWSK